MKCSLLTCGLLAITAASGWAQNTVLLLDSDPGESLAHGASYYFTPAEGVFTATQNYDNGVSVGFSSGTATWSLDFAGPDAALLTVQTYPNATRFPFQAPGVPGLDVNGNYSGCNTLTGEFEVKEIVYGPDGTVTAFDATFIQHCEGFGPALTGEILYNSDQPIPPKNHLTSALSAAATRNHFFQYQIRASNSPTSFTAANLPAGLSLNASSGLISGSPTVQGTFSVPLSAIGAGGTASGTLSLTIDPPGQSTGAYTALFLESEAGAFLGQGNTYLFLPFDGYFTARHDTANWLRLDFVTPDYIHNWSLNFYSPEASTIGIGSYFNATRFAAPADPGLDISGDGSGCNESSGSFVITDLSLPGNSVGSFRATFEDHCENMVPALRGEVWFNASNAITSDPLVETTRDQAFSFQIIANNQPLSYGATALPPGLSVNGTTGIISGTPTLGGIFSIPVTATGPDATASDRLTLIVNPPNGDNAPVVTSARTAGGTIQQLFSYQVVATHSPTQFSATGLPTGVTIDGASGLISGTPTVSGTFDVILTATNANGAGGRSLTLSIYPPTPVITSANQATAAGGKPFSFQISATNQPSSYSASGLPDGLTINAGNGLISGTPAVTGTFTAVVRAGNGSGVGFQTLTLTVNLTAPEITSALLATGVEGQPFDYQITANGLPESFSASGLPDGLSFSSYDGIIYGAPTIGGTFNVLITASNAAGIDTAILVLNITAKPSQLLNLSTRLAVGTDDAVLIGGFIVTGSSTKTVLIRGIGPTLTDFGVAGALTDPTLELYDAAGTLLATNDNWRDSQQDQIQATQLAPSNDLESAILFSLPANGAGYTAIIRGKDGGIGVGLVEVYDLDQFSDSLVANISTRGVVGSGDDVMVGGFIIGGGSADGTVMVRAIGPSLATFGVSGVLLDPTLELHDGDGNTIVSDDNWKDAQQGQIEATGIPPADDREAAIVATLPTGPYTAIVQGKDATTGVALVEVYRLP